MSVNSDFTTAPCTHSVSTQKVVTGANVNWVRHPDTIQVEGLLLVTMLTNVHSPSIRRNVTLTPDVSTTMEATNAYVGPASTVRAGLDNVMVKKN